MALQKEVWIADIHCMFKFFNSECNILHTRANKLSTNLKALCSCNHNQLTGFSTTFGCTKGNKTNVCKFNVIPKKFGRQRFAMHGKKKTLFLNIFSQKLLTELVNLQNFLCLCAMKIWQIMSLMQSLAKLASLVLPECQS